MSFKIFMVTIISLTYYNFAYGRKYDNYTLYNLYAKEIEHLEFLSNLEKQKYIDVLFWSKPKKLHDQVQLMVSPTDKELFKERIEHFKVPAEILLLDVQKAFDNQIMQKYHRSRTETFVWDYYHSLEDIYQWLIDISLKNSNKTNLENIGKTIEGRDIYAITINANDDLKKAIVVGGVHGHEWISVDFVTYLINKLLDAEKSTNSKLLDIASQYTWHLIPVLNPDGLDYSMKHDRLWRKNRRITSGAIGVDLERNFDISFCKHDTSRNPGDDYYCGPGPFSELETKALVHFITRNRYNLKFYFVITAYGERIVIPYADRIRHIDNFSEMENYAKQAALLISNRFGTRFKIGTSYDTFGTRMSGNSASWVKKIFKIPLVFLDTGKTVFRLSYGNVVTGGVNFSKIISLYVYTIYLRDNGTYGHALPPSQIIPTCEETLTGITELMTVKPRHVSYNNASTVKLGCVFIEMCCLFILLK